MQAKRGEKPHPKLEEEMVEELGDALVAGVERGEEGEEFGRGFTFTQTIHTHMHVREGEERKRRREREGREWRSLPVEERDGEGGGAGVEEVAGGGWECMGERERE